MNRTLAIAILVLTAVSVEAKPRFELIATADGVRRNSGANLEPGIIYDPEFDTGGGLGVALNWHVAERASIEAKVSALTSNTRLRVMLSDFIGTVDLGRSNIYPVMLTMQWHPFADGGTFRPYVGAGVAHVLVQSIEATPLTPEVDFNNPTGLLVNAGLRVSLSDAWHLVGDARWVPVETSGGVRFGPESPVIDMDVRPLVVGFGVAYRFESR